MHNSRRAAARICGLAMRSVSSENGTGSSSAAWLSSEAQSIVRPSRRGGVPFLEIGDEGLALKAFVQQPGVGELVNHARMLHQIAHRPARQPQQGKQPGLDSGSLHQQGEVALPSQQGFNPVDKAQRALNADPVFADRLCGAADQFGQTQPGFLAQGLNARRVRPAACGRGQFWRQLFEELLGIDGQWRAATALAAS